MTSGFDQSPRLWRAAESLKSEILPGLTDPVMYRRCVAIGNDASLWVAAGSKLYHWPSNALDLAAGDASPSNSKIPPPTSTFVESEVTAVTTHPTIPAVAVVATDYPKILLVGNRSYGQIGGGTAVTNFVRQMEFDPSGGRLYVLYEGGGLERFLWSDLVRNDPSSRSVTPISTGIRDAEFLLPPNETYQFVAAARSGGGLTNLQPPSGAPAEDVLTPRLASPITAAARSQGPDASENVLVVGTLDGRVKTQSGDLSSKTSSPLDLADGPVRDIACTPDGRWAVAGTATAAWVWPTTNADPTPLKLPLGGVSADSLLIDPIGDWLLVGCGDGNLLAYRWTHCQLAAMASAGIN